MTTDESVRMLNEALNRLCVADTHPLVTRRGLQDDTRDLDEVIRKIVAVRNSLAKARAAA